MENYSRETFDHLNTFFCTIAFNIAKKYVKKVEMCFKYTKNLMKKTSEVIGKGKWRQRKWKLLGGFFLCGQKWMSCAMKDLMTDLHWEVFFLLSWLFVLFPIRIVSFIDLVSRFCWLSINFVCMNVVISNFTNRLHFLIEFFVWVLK